MSEKRIGQIAYEAYANSRSNKAFDWSPLPEWADVKPEIQGAWDAAAKAVAEQAINGRIRL